MSREANERVGWVGWQTGHLFYDNAFCDFGPLQAVATVLGFGDGSVRVVGGGGVVVFSTVGLLLVHHASQGAQEKHTSLASIFYLQ